MTLVTTTIVTLPTTCICQNPWQQLRCSKVQMNDAIYINASCCWFSSHQILLRYPPLAKQLWTKLMKYVCYLQQSQRISKDQKSVFYASYEFSTSTYVRIFVILCVFSMVLLHLTSLKNMCSSSHFDFFHCSFSVPSPWQNHLPPPFLSSHLNPFSQSL